MTANKSSTKLTALGVSITVTLALIAFGWARVAAIDLHRISVSLLLPMGRLMILIGIGLVAGQLIEAAGWTRHLAAAAAPMFRFGRLGIHCSAAFTTAFFSGTAANAMLYDFYKEGKIDKRQLYLANFVNQLPAYFLHLPTTVFIVLPLTGAAGGIYFLLTFAATAFRTGAFLVYGRLRIQNSADTVKNRVDTATPEKENHSVWTGIRKRFPYRIMGIAIYVLPIYTLVFVLNAMGVFLALRQWLSGFVVTTIVPVESLSLIILSFVAEFSSGFAAAGALLEAGVLTVKQAALALLIGNIVAFPVRALRHQLPRYMGIFTPRMGGEILLMGQLFRVTSIILVGAAYYCWG